MKTPILYLAMALLILACRSKTEDLNASAEVMYDMTPPAANAPMKEMVKFSPPSIKDDAVESELTPRSGSQHPRTKKIIKDGNISIRVEEVEKAKKKMDAIVKQAGGYYENEEFENYENRTLYSLKIRVPCQKFETLLRAAEKADGEITVKTINTRDVTEEYVDTEIRLESKKLFRKRYNELLSKAAKVDDILSIEENIRTLQEEIESQEGKLRFLDDQVMYSTLDITLFHNKEIIQTGEKPLTGGQRVKISLSSGWNRLVDLCLWCVQQWPWILSALVLFLLIRSIIKRKRRVA